VRGPDGFIQTEAFLDVCRAVLPVIGGSMRAFVHACPVCVHACAGAGAHARTPCTPCTHAHADKLGAAFAIVRSDISGNIDRLAGRVPEDPQFAKLFAIVQVLRAHTRISTHTQTHAHTHTHTHTSEASDRL
jgi:hypothetical protein